MPNLILLAGPNGAGKSTAAREFLQGALGVDEFVNADVVARGLSAFAPERAAMEAGRITLARLRELTARRLDVAFETTLASRSFAPWIRGLIESGYQFHLLFLWLPSPELAVARVAERVRLGGHSVPEDVVVRRYQARLRNFFELYMPIATTWRFYDNEDPRNRRLVARGGRGRAVLVRDARLWEKIKV